MTKKELITKIKNQFEIRRHEAQVKADNFVEELKEDKEFNQIYLNFNLANLKLIKAKHENSNVATAQSQFDECYENLKTWLKAHNISEKKLYPQYKCKLCSDKGVVKGKMCECLSNEINAQLSKLNSSYNNFHTFSMINQAKMDENLNIIYAQLFNWCTKFPSEKINVNLFGSVGVGKTFLLECISSKLIEDGFNLHFLTAFAFNEECRKYHFSQPNNMENILNCDCLVIDDLGTEPILKNITIEYLYNVVNLRQAKNKATLISTNLSMEDLFIRYGERTCSRLLNKATALTYNINGANKRLR